MLELDEHEVVGVVVSMKLHEGFELLLGQNVVRNDPVQMGEGQRVSLSDKELFRANLDLFRFGGFVDVGCRDGLSQLAHVQPSSLSFHKLFETLYQANYWWFLL